MIRAALVVAVLLAAACAPRLEHDGLRFEERRARLSAEASWRMQGRLAIDTGERAGSGRFSWIQDGDVSTLLVRGPLGGGVLEVTGTQSEMIVTSRGERRVLTDPETDLSALLGWWVPVESLDAWLLGLPDPRFRADTRVGPSDALQRLDQRFWRVEYVSYQLIGGVLVPRRIEMTHDDLYVRITVDDWSTDSLNSAALGQHNTALEAIDRRWGVAKW